MIAPTIARDVYRVARKLGKAQRMPSFGVYADLGRHAPMTIVRQSAFGTWSGAAVEIGLEPNRPFTPPRSLTKLLEEGDFCETLCPSASITGPCGGCVLARAIQGGAARPHTTEDR